MRLQLFLNEVISVDQMAFLPLRYIIDNVLLTHKTVQWAKQTKQDLVINKVDIAKAYNTMNWKFVFSTMVAIRIHHIFIAIITRLFQDVHVVLNINGIPQRVI